MENMSREEFEELKNSAAQEIRELKERQAGLPPFPNFVKIPNREERPTRQFEQGEREFSSRQSTPKHEQQIEKKPPNRLGGFLKNINLAEMLKDKDSWIILGLIFLLSNEEADESLILALAYILL